MFLVTWDNECTYACYVLAYTLIHSILDTIKLTAVMGRALIDGWVEIRRPVMIALLSTLRATAETTDERRFKAAIAVWLMIALLVIIVAAGIAAVALNRRSIARIDRRFDQLEATLSSRLQDSSEARQNAAQDVIRQMREARG